MKVNKKIKLASIYLFGVLYIIAGILHFINPEFYLQLMPPIIPLSWHLSLINVSGIAEIFLGIGLIIPSTRKISAYGIVALLIAVFPANIYMAFNYELLHEMDVSPLFAIAVRLPLQFVLIGIANWQSSYQ